MKNSLQLKFASNLAGLGLARKGFEVVFLADDVLLVIAPKKKGDIARQMVAQVVIHPCETVEEAKAGASFTSANIVADLPVYVFSFVSLDDNRENAYVRKELAELLQFGPKDSVTLHIVD